jgi:hypothetical protein
MNGSLDVLGCSRREFVVVDMAVALFAFIPGGIPALRRGPWNSFAPIIPERRGTVEGVMHFGRLSWGKPGTWRKVTGLEASEREK